MSRNNKIIVSANPSEQFMEGFIGVGHTPKPGTVMQKDVSVALVGGRHTYVPYNRAADADRPAGALYILLEDELQGKTMTDAYAAGERCFLYVPQAGDEFNMILLDAAVGTGDDHTKGEILMIDDGTGKLVATTGTPETESFVLLEDVTDPAADTLAWVEYSGY